MFIIICEDILLIYKFDILCRCIIIEYVDRIYFRDIKRCVCVGWGVGEGGVG